MLLAAWAFSPDYSMLAEAENMYWRALGRNEKALGPEQTSTLDTVNNLGITFHGNPEVLACSPGANLDPLLDEGFGCYRRLVCGSSCH